MQLIIVFGETGLNYKRFSVIYQGEIQEPKKIPKGEREIEIMN